MNWQTRAISGISEARRNWCCNIEWSIKLAATKMRWLRCLPVLYTIYMLVIFEFVCVFDVCCGNYCHHNPLAQSTARVMRRRLSALFEWTNGRCEVLRSHRQLRECGRYQSPHSHTKTPYDIEKIQTRMRHYIALSESAFALKFACVCSEIFVCWRKLLCC